MESKMNLKKFSRFLFLTISIFLFTKTSFSQDSDVSKYDVKEKLGYPFGTLLKMKVEIFDGNNLNDKYHQSSFLFRIKSIDSIALPETVIMEFKDETGKFSSDYNEKLKKYVGKEFTIVAYETGEFSGIPKGYFKYQPVRQDFGFHFKNYLIVVADMTNANQ
jgi:hypothetical protein